MRVWPPSVRMLLLPTENVKTPVGMPRRWQTGGGRTAGLPIGLGRWLLAGISLIPALGRAEGGPDLARLQGWAIAVATNAPAVEHYAAEELQTHLETATGHRLPLVKPDASDGFEGLVLVGTQASGLATDELGQEGTRWIADADRIRLAGGHPRGTLYAVYDFLESALGVRFLTPEHTHIPPVGEALPLVRGERRFVPPLDFRWSYYGEVNANPVFAARLRNNTVALDERLGGKTSTGLINHSFSRYVPWARYGASNPEYFNEIGGKRPSETINDHEGPGVQLCLTNPDVLQKVIEGVLADLKHAPRSRNISVSPNDNLQYCRCDACRTVDAREGSPSGTLFTFVNAVAEAVEPHYPDVLVGTLAYKYSR